MNEEEYFEAIRKIKADFITKVPANLSNEVLKVVGKRLKVKNIIPSKDGKEEHYVTGKGTFTADDVVGY